MGRRLPMAAAGLLALTLGLPATAEEPAAGAGGPPSPFVWHYGQPAARDFGVADGRCRSTIVGILARQMMNHPAGEQPGRWDDKPVAVILGPVLATDLVDRLGRDADAADRGCLGQTLEVAPDNHAVAWSNRGLSFTVQPGRGQPRGNYYCREFSGRVRGGNVDGAFTGFACRSGRGLWRAI